MTILNKLLCLMLLLSAIIIPQKKDENKDTLNSEITGAFKWRSIGPAVTGGRIADLAVNPQNKSEYYVAVASGHIWKTTNAGTTFTPVFDKYGAYSMGCLAMDPNNSFVVWAGTGENNHQRSLGYGNGVYKTVNGGKTWTNMGLKESRQIGKIVIDPRNSNIVFVAAEGSVWGSGGERGLYKTIDGGKAWKKVLEISTNTGVNNIVFDPRNPDLMYATSEQRRRHVFTKIGGGPESAVYKSIDGGETWEKSMSGLPSIDLGGMGIAVSPVNPDIVYLILEAAEKNGGFYRSNDRGATWDKMSDHTEAGQYYNEIYCDPKDVNKVYSVETFSQVTLDGGKTWRHMGNNNRHVDDHALWIDPDNTKHIMIGGDGGLYETFDACETWNFKSNLPITQLYRVAVDNATPFYNVYGGTQDNNSFGGPSRTMFSNGIVNSDWFLTNGGDGFWSAIDPVDPNIIYAESQYGGMVRYDKKSGEAIGIRPEPEKGGLTYKWNWNTPLFVSPHSHTRIYTAANKVFRSDDRGDSWQIISEDLTAQIDRNTWKVMDKFWSVDAVAKDKSTSLYGEIISLAESPIKENLLYAGTDDGLIQVSEDAKTWRKSDDFPGVPENTYVSDVMPSKFDENVVFASFDNILRDDFKPYLLKSKDKGKSWKSIAGNLPNRATVHSIEQDFINPDLLFVGTEFGVYTTTDGGSHWSALNAGLPDVAVKDITIQKRENDLVIATFGRGFYIVDNYSALRKLSGEKSLLEKDAAIFPIKDALMYMQNWRNGSQGSSYFSAPNPEFGAVISYYIKDVPKTLSEIRKEKETELFKNGDKIPQPSDAELIAEEREVTPYLVLTISDEAGSVVRKITKSASKGVSETVWDLRNTSFSPVDSKDKFNPTNKIPSGSPVMPGKYKVSLSLVSRAGSKELCAPVEFNAVALRNTTLPASDSKGLENFQLKASRLARTITGTYQFLQSLISRIESVKTAILQTPKASHSLLAKADSISAALDNMLLKFELRSTRPSAEENPPAPVKFNDRVDNMVYTHWNSTSNLTKNELVAYETLTEEFPPVYNEIKRIFNEDILTLEKQIELLSAPATPGRLPELIIEK